MYPLTSMQILRRSSQGTLPWGLNSKGVDKQRFWTCPRKAISRNARYGINTFGYHLCWRVSCVFCVVFCWSDEILLDWVWLYERYYETQRPHDNLRDCAYDIVIVFKTSQVLPSFIYFSIVQCVHSSANVLREATFLCVDIRFTSLWTVDDWWYVTN